MLTLLALFASACQDPPPTVPARAAERTTTEEPWFTPEQGRTAAAAAERGLRWLAARQLESGCWTGLVGHKMNDDYMQLDQGLLPDEQRRTGHGHLGVTALCGMAFLAGGNLPDRGPHGALVQRTVDYVNRTARENGLLTDAGTRMYSHAFATLFLAEVYGMAASDATKRTLERAVNLIVDSQNEHGGWRYNPFDREIDLSVTVCQVQALRGARNIGIRVPPDTIDRALDYVRRSRVQNGRSRGLFYYKIVGRGAYDKPNEYAINAAALTALSSAGVHDADLVDPVLEFLGQEYGPVADYQRSHFYYWYGNYYAAQAFYQAGGTRLRAFFQRLCTDLIESQQGDGRWRNDPGPGDEFATAVACILLQMPRQYLPIFQR
ncbi:MAG: prenyltransferase [Planctomycetota bacterium]